MWNKLDWFVLGLYCVLLLLLNIFDSTLGSAAIVITFTPLIAVIKTMTVVEEFVNGRCVVWGGLVNVIHDHNVADGGGFNCIDICYWKSLGFVDLPEGLCVITEVSD